MLPRKLVLATFALALLGACASESSDEAGSSGAVSAEFADADVTFAQEMIPHHEQAIEMAELALAPEAGAGADVTALATRIVGAQTSEIDLMTGWLESWDEPLDGGGHDMDAMDGMMSEADMDTLAQQSGPAFDSIWLVMMIEHHQGAISMAETVQAEGTNPDVAELAAAIVTAQTAEIEEMNALLGS